MQLRLHDVATLFGVSESTVSDWVREASLPARWVNNAYRFNRGELIEWATLHRMTLPAPLLRPENGDARLSIADALAAGGIHYQVPGADKAAVLREAARRIPQISAIDRGQLHELLLAREASGGTAIGGGIAIPHPGRPLVLPTDEALITLCFLEQEVDFSADDGQPVRALFLLVTPTARVHLQLLAQLASALRSDRFRAAIEAQKSAGEIVAEARGFMEQKVAAGACA